MKNRNGMKKISLDKIRWTPKMSVGEKRIDNQHKRLLDQIQKLLDETSSESQLKKSRDTFHFLYIYIKEHLKYEENYMEINGYPDFKKHKKIHDNFIRFFEEFKNNFYKHLYAKLPPGELISTRLDALTNETRNFLGLWWINHISTIDQKYAEYMGNKEGGAK